MNCDYIEQRIGAIHMHYIIGQNRLKGKRADLQIIVNINLQYFLFVKKFPTFIVAEPTLFEKIIIVHTTA